MNTKLIRKDELTSSAGFKSLKIRNSHSYRPMSGVLINNDSFIIPFDMSDLAFATSMKMDLYNIEQEIQNISKMAPIGQKQFTQPHINKIKQYANSLKQKEANLDAHKIVQLCQCIDTNEAVVKLYNLVYTLDSYITKVTELQCLHFLQNECFLEEFKSNYIQKIAQQGVIPNRLTMSLVNMEIINFLIQRLSKSKGSQQIQEGGREYQEIIEKQKNQMKQMRIDYQKLEIENKKLMEQQLELSTNINVNQQQPTNYYCKLMDDVKESYQNLISILREENQQINLKLIEITQKYDQVKGELQDCLKKQEQLKQTKDDLYRRLSLKYKSVQEYEQSYEAALRDEYQQMQVAYESKVNKLQTQLDQQLKDYQKQYSEMKFMINSLTDKERLLTKKLMAYMKI